MDEAHLLIDANSSRVGLKRGQERDAALGVNVARDCGDKSLSIAAAAEVRVCADGTHFRDPIGANRWPAMNPFGREESKRDTWAIPSACIARTIGAGPWNYAVR